MDLPSMTRENASEMRQIADGASRHINALKALKRPTSHWDDLLIFLLSSKLDTVSMREWQNSLITTELPTFKQFLDFVTHRSQMLEASGKPNSTTAKAEAHSSAKTKRQAACAASVKFRCTHCKEEHSIYFCPKFLALTVHQRIAEVRKAKLCANRLRSTSHNAGKCVSGTCKTCKMKHNTLLHLDTSTADSQGRDEKSQSIKASTTSSTTVVTHGFNYRYDEHIMLATAVIYAFDNKESRKPCRILLDSGSQANFISKGFLDVLNIKAKDSNISISEINNMATTSSQIAQIQLQSRINSFSAKINCFVTDRVTDKIPSFTLKRSAFDIPRNIELADPQFHVSSDIDILIGAELFWQILCVGQIKNSPGHPTLQKTRFGWIPAGRAAQSSQSTKRIQAFAASISNAQLDEQFSRLWKMETIEGTRNLTTEELACEQHFVNTIERTAEGRYMACLPFKKQVEPKFENTRDIALKRLHGLERRFTRDPALKIQYTRFLDEYRALGHMKQVTNWSKDEQEVFYLPHHCVFKNAADRSKIRVVFDASCKDSTGTSLNDTLLTGPVIQQDLMSILVRFRTFRYAFVADIIKMYRQILIHPSQTRYQRILWRDDRTADVETYELTTVTYGTSSASFIATRCLKQLAETYHGKYPVAASHVRRDFYMDDLLTGADSIAQAKKARDEIIQLLREGSFELNKWASNCPELLDQVTKHDRVLVPIGEDKDSSVLGIHWNHAQDTFYFSFKIGEHPAVISKRTILSELSSLFDPLGLVGPVLVLAKLIMQDLWQADIHWDESVPPNIDLRWKNLRLQIPIINHYAIPRCVRYSTRPGHTQLHGFCDASERAYGACIYIRTQIKANKFRVELLCSKSRVAPIKSQSLPRLELAAAVLLAQLVDKISEAIHVDNIPIFLWSDSTITLNWISSPSRKWTVFVANRVGEVQRLTRIDSWRHVSSANNPADILSRGQTPGDLLSAALWWHGALFLMEVEQKWPNRNFNRLEPAPELRRVAAAVAAIGQSDIEELLCKCSNLSKACRILAYCLRLGKVYNRNTSRTFISLSECRFALDIMCREIQKRSFPSEYRALSKDETINPSSSLLSLSPFLHTDGLIRVGGRLRESDLNFDASHSILLPRGHILTKRIIEQEHIRNAHAGIQATMATIRQRFWPLSLRSTTRKIVHECITCFKAKPSLSEVVMGSLPAGRVTVSRPFYHCGVDYAGPVIREGKRRNARSLKAYISIFVCFATKAVHIELVSDLTSNAFIAALKRFVARRGKPEYIYSDNGTTFVGAQGQLKQFYEFLKDDKIQSEIQHFVREQQFSWSFIPPNAPHFGGLWEAAVKSAKYHLNRIVGKANLTFEELATVLCEIEAILNSRPLTPLSEDPNDLSCLTPGHFLVGAPLNSFPCEDLTDVNENRLVRWQRVEQMRQHFWRRWSVEYLHTLQERNKWKTNKGQQLRVDQIVLLKQQGLAPMQWLIGRIEKTHAGPDGQVRTATVRTASGKFVRPLTKIAILPLNN
ncbi:uncharacterized protein LOC112468186 [Temnothorax curvispinosus]|uniref:Uncharacterized protein LOC112468186 n=1 Tax=Temnothorax curvispinosus TaxID=300111 RepID=A0A6J1RFD9_9HYME|nr:uncharacterized protein LOC112468186 [Temnothorax curvispinosus]